MRASKECWLTVSNAEGILSCNFSFDISFVLVHIVRIYDRYNSNLHKQHTFISNIQPPCLTPDKKHQFNREIRPSIPDVRVSLSCIVNATSNFFCSIVFIRYFWCSFSFITFRTLCAARKSSVSRPKIPPRDAQQLSCRSLGRVKASVTVILGLILYTNAATWRAKQEVGLWME